MFRKNTWPNVRVTEVEVAFHSFGYRAPHRCQLCLYCIPRAPNACFVPCLSAGTDRGAAPRRAVRMALEAEDGMAIRGRSGIRGACLITLEKAQQDLPILIG